MNALVSGFAAAPPSDALSVSTAVLILLTGAVAYCLHAIADLRRQLRRLEREAARPPAAAAGTPVAMPAAAAPPPGSPPPPARERLSPQLLAVIAAAVHATLGGRHRVLAVAPVALPASTWSVEGRREIFTSHHVR